MSTHHLWGLALEMLWTRCRQQNLLLLHKVLVCGWEGISFQSSITFNVFPMTEYYCRATAIKTLMVFLIALLQSEFPEKDCLIDEGSSACTMLIFNLQQLSCLSQCQKRTWSPLKMLFNWQLVLFVVLEKRASSVQNWPHLEMHDYMVQCMKESNLKITG